MDEYMYIEDLYLDQDFYGVHQSQFVHGYGREMAAVKEKDTHSYPTDSIEALRIFYIIVNYVSYPICGVGIVANIIVLWVWSMERGYNATTYLFKALAVADIIHLTFFPIWHSVRGLVFRNLFIAKIMCGSKKYGLLITMVLAVVRTIKLFWPLEEEKLLSHWRMKAVLAGFIVWSNSVGYVTHILSLFGYKEIKELYQFIVPFGFSGIIPGLLQVCVMIVLVWKISQTTRVSPTSTMSASSSSMQQERRNTRQLVFTVFLICTVTFIAYPVSSIVTIMIDVERTEWVTVFAYRRVFFGSFQLVTLINSSINLVFYIVFVASFQIMFKRRLSDVHKQFTNTSFFFFITRSTVRSQTRTSENQVVRSASAKKLKSEDNRRMFGAIQEVETSNTLTTLFS